ncbi:cytochrome P460 family protein [Allomesorhizobium camelthorni]|uniref:Cytochrome P460 family protein n=1 Tax=Allomesorhizobium camelthorni TaxID=475069 RepID=A0A6G4WPI2_9HYPH|nr:cytochrome P460 family protein [Mesorhizobium camelthorni]NGO56020.1 cytochrome P460 family protein [Mesorhizobium camelthorni]
MKRLSSFALAASAAVFLAAPLFATPDRVKLPAQYSSGFVLYNKVDRPDRKRVRFMYVNPEAHARARPGEILPEGTILIMEDHDVAIGADGNPVLDKDGRLMPTDALTGIFVMEKRTGFGAANELPPDKDNGDWDYAAYKADGSPNSEAKLESCFACHMSRSNRDFTFTYFKNVEDGLPK